MSSPPPAPGTSETTAAGPSAARPGGVPRRSFLIGGVTGGLTGVAAGTAAGRATISPPPPAPAPEPPPPVLVEKPLPAGAKLSYAQFGEDLIASSLFYPFKIDKPTYLDVGAFEPITSNNTYLFYSRGARGVLVEPTPHYAEKLRAVRPGDTVLGVGIGVAAATEMDFYVMNEPQQNTFDKAYAEKYVREKGYRIEKVLKIPLVDINRVIADNFGGTAPDYLSIDAEGLEFEILKTLDLRRYRPKVVCIETLVANTLEHDPSITRHMAEHGYEVRGMSYPNTLYADGRFLKEHPKYKK